jgi:hypothetical protein
MADKKDDPELSALMERYGLGASKTSESKPAIKSDVPVQVTSPPQEEVVPEEASIQGEALIQAQERAEADALNKLPENVIERNRLIAEVGAGLGGGDWNIIEQLINDCDPEDTVTKICWVL